MSRPQQAVGALVALSGVALAKAGGEQRVHDIIDAQARLHPDDVAVSAREGSLTYRELTQRSRALAVHLRTIGLRDRELVAIYMERSLDMVVGLLAILKAGGAYVPLDPMHPGDRLAAILRDSQARFVLTQTGLRSGAQELTSRCGGQMSLVLADAVRETAGAVRPPGWHVEGEAPAYVIYTSGSTGTPKGVLVPHRALSNLLQSMACWPGLDRSDVLLSVTTLGFDVATMDVLLPLMRGARCHVCDSRTARDPELLISRIAEVRPTVMQLQGGTRKDHVGCRSSAHCAIGRLNLTMPASGIDSHLTRLASRAIVAETATPKERSCEVPEHARSSESPRLRP